MKYHSMSKIGKIPVEIKEGVAVLLESGVITVTGPKGRLSFRIPASVEVLVQEHKIMVAPRLKTDPAKALVGLTRATAANMIHGVHTGFERKLELSGVGYRAQVAGGDLVLSVGFSHPVTIKADEGITFGVAENMITVSGTDKTRIGDVAARIRAIRPPEPYKGKGILYQGERIRRKAGKAAKAVGAK